MWSEDELLVLRILPDPEFINGVIEEVTSFFKYGVLPELLGKWYTKTPIHCTSSDFRGDETDQTQNSSLAVTSGVIVEDQRKDK